jgi:hypothetical protein
MVSGKALVRFLVHDNERIPCLTESQKSFIKLLTT